MLNEFRWAAVAVMVLGAGLAVAQEKHRFDVTSQPLSAALNELAAQAGINIYFDPPDVEGKKAREVRVEETAEGALGMLLEGTGLRVVRVDAQTVRVVGKGQAEGEVAQEGGQGQGQDQARGGADGVGKGEANELREIIVTAQKKKEHLQDVPATVDVLQGEQLERQGVADIKDFAKQVPGLTGIDTGSSPGFSAPTIRGMGLAGIVTTYLDDIPFTASAPFDGSGEGTFDPDIADVDHIEVLEGPQSTLYGADAEGGVIKYVTKQPDLNNFSGNTRIYGSKIDGGGSGYGARGTVNIPVVGDRVAVRASAFYREDPGFYNNTFNSASNVNRFDVGGGRAAVLFKISDNLENTVSGSLLHIYTPSLGGIYVDPVTLKPLLGGLNFASPERLTKATSATSFANTTKWDLHSATLTNILSFANISDNLFLDYSALGQALGAGGASGQFIPISNRLTDEIRLASAPGRLEYLLGGFFTRERDHQNTNAQGTDAQGQVLAPSDPSYNILSFREDWRFTERAVFGDLTYHLTDQLEGTVGMRYSSNNISWQKNSSGILSNPSENTASSDSSSTYLATASYKPESNLTLYLRAASAYRPGFPQFLTNDQIAAGGNEHVGPDRMWDYEVGAKGFLFDQRVKYSADVFRMRWTDIQSTVIAGGFTYTANFGSALSDGAEASLQFIPIKGLTISTNGAYIHARITSDIESLNAVSGQPLPGSPRWKAAALADYQWNLGNGISPDLGLTYAYMGAWNTAFAGGSGIFGTGGIYTVPSYATLDLRAGVDWSRYNVLLYVNNATNKYAYDNLGTPGAPAGFPLEGFIIRPRTIGLSAAMRF